MDNFSNPIFQQIGLIAALCCLFIGTVVLFLSNKSRYSFMFAFSAFTSAIWLSINTILLPLSLGDLDILVKLSFISAFMTLLFIWEFSYFFTLSVKSNLLIRLLNTANIILVFIFILLHLFTNLIIEKTYYVDDSLILEFGRLYVFSALLFIYLFIANLYILITKIKYARSKVNLQLKLFIFGFGLTTATALITNLIFPLFSNNSNSSRVGPLAIIFYIFFTSFAILRYQFLDIRIIVGRITYFLLTGSIAYAAFYLVIFVDNTFFGGVYEPGAYIAGIFIAILFVVLFNSTNHFIRHQVSSRIINPFYDPNEVIAELNSKITTILSYEEITNQTLETISKTLRPSYQGVLIIRKDRNIGAVSIKLIQPKEALVPISIDKLNLAQSIWKVVGFMPINIDKIENEYPAILKNLEKEVGLLLEELKRCDLKVIYPLHQSGELLAILILGHKEANLPFNTIEQNFIASIADLASLALARAFLYAEVEEFNQTLQKKVEDATEEIKDKNKKLQDTLNFERDMLDILGHELRTPLGTARNALLTMQKLSKDNNLDPANLNKLLGMSIDHIRREVQLLETILASTKVDNAKLDLAISKVDAKKIAQTTYEIYNSDAEKKDLKLIITLPDNDIYCMADPLRLQQVIDNIVSNAVKYTFKGQIEISLETDSYFVKFVVKDTGEGIPASDIPNLGKKFFRVNTYLKSEGKLSDNRKIVRPGGTGIGLYVVFELTKAMKGRVEVKSKLGEGSTFTVFIPKAK